jgi:hypothetical protein
MWIIQHRVNMPSDLRMLPRHHGAEVDLRYHCDTIVLAHDPYGHHRQNLASFEDWIAGWDHEGPLILNVKTEGLEDDCIALMRKHGVRNWFFLDMSPPYLVRFSLAAARHEIPGFTPANLAVRFSEHEPLDYALSFAGRAGWVWVDCFSRMPLDSEAAARLREAGFRICIVSPELQKHDLGRIAEFRGLLESIQPDAVCTKRPDLWLQHPQKAQQFSA